MNKVQLYGRVSYKGELRKTSSDLPVINISVATGYGDRVTFVPVTIWSKQADIVQAYVNKGDRVLIEGRVSASNTTRDDKKFTEYKVTADFVHLVETKKDKQDDVAPQDFAPDPVKDVLDDGMPF